MCTELELLEGKVPRIFLVTEYFSQPKDRRYPFYFRYALEYILQIIRSRELCTQREYKEWDLDFLRT
jgi:hypothetical protein